MSASVLSHTANRGEGLRPGLRWHFPCSSTPALHWRCGWPTFEAKHFYSQRNLQSKQHCLKHKAWHALNTDAKCWIKAPLDPSPRIYSFRLLEANIMKALWVHQRWAFKKLQSHNREIKRGMEIQIKATMYVLSWNIDKRLTKISDFKSLSADQLRGQVTFLTIAGC